MKACGLIVEYNPFHNGHLFHLQASQEKSKAECMVAVMSGNFLQRGEPAIIDKWHRTQIALQSGVDIVVELPFAFAVQHADIFAKGAILTLQALGVSSICFGSELGDITPFQQAYYKHQSQQDIYYETLQFFLNQGLSFPESGRKAYEAIGLTEGAIDLSQPNNILGFSYVKAIHDNELPIEPMTIHRKHSGYHDQVIDYEIASATSIRKDIFTNKQLTSEARQAIPKVTEHALSSYKKQTNCWHEWEAYFAFLHYRVSTATVEELANIHGVGEGLEYRLKKTVSRATSFNQWMTLLKTKRYTWTRLQRMFVHILTNTTSKELKPIHNLTKAPYVRLLGMTERGQAYLKQIKKEMPVPLLPTLQQGNDPSLVLDERAVDSYLTILSPSQRMSLKKQELTPPIMVK